jgi:hypothetical protein
VRRTLSRESNGTLQKQAQESGGALLVSFWRSEVTDDVSGTPIDWLNGLSGRLVNVRCLCPPEVAARRFVNRRRHIGHFDNGRSFDTILKSFVRCPGCYTSAAPSEANCYSMCSTPSATPPKRNRNRQLLSANFGRPATCRPASRDGGGEAASRLVTVSSSRGLGITVPSD